MKNRVNYSFMQNGVLLNVIFGELRTKKCGYVETNNKWLIFSSNTTYCEIYWNGSYWAYGNIYFNAVGEYTVTITYGNDSTSFNVSCNYFRWSSNPDGSEVYEGESTYFNLYYYGDSEYEYPTITIEGADGYSYTYEATTIGGYYWLYDDDNTTYIELYRTESDSYGRIRGYVYFNVVGEYTVTITFGDDSTSFAVTVNPIPAHISTISNSSIGYGYGNGAVNVVMDMVVAYNTDFSLNIYAENAAITVMLDGVELTEGDSWYCEQNGNYNYIYINSGVLTEGVTNTLVVTAVGDNGTATATLNLTLSDWIWSVNPDGINVYEGVSTYFYLSYYGDSEYEYPTITIEGADGYSYTYEATTIGGYYWLYDDDNITYIDIGRSESSSYVRIYGYIYFNVAGEYTVTITYGEDSTSFNVTVIEYLFDGEITANEIYYENSGWLSDGAEITEYVDEWYYQVVFCFTAPNKSTINVTIDGEELPSESYDTWWDCGSLEVYFNPGNFVEAGMHTIIVTVERDGYGAASLTITYILIGEVNAYISEIVAGDKTLTYNAYDGITVEESFTVYSDGSIQVFAYATDADISVMLDGSEWTEYTIETDGSIVISTSALGEGTYTIEITVSEAEGGTATATLYVTVESAWRYAATPSNYIYEDGLIYFDLYYYGNADYDYPVVTISDGTSTYTIDRTVWYTYEIYDDDNNLVMYYNLYYSGNNVWGNIWFYKAGEYTVTVSFGDASESFDVAVEEYVFSGEVGFTGLAYYSNNSFTYYGYDENEPEFEIELLDYIEATQNYKVEVIFNAPEDAVVSITSDPNIEVEYTTSYSQGYLTIYFTPEDVTGDEIGTYIFEITVSSEDYGSYTVTVTYILKEVALEYTLSDDGEYYILSSIGGYAYVDFSEITIIIDETYNGLPVKEIGEYAFSYSGIVSISIPDSVTSIGDYAFYRCSSLTSVIIPDSVTYIGDYAFYYCSRLTDVTLGNSVEYIGTNAFRYTSISEINLPDSLLTIGSWAFRSTNITSLTIPASVTSIGNHIAASPVTEYIVAEGNETYKSVDGVIYSADGTVLVLYPAGRTDTSFTVPEGVTTIGDYAFWMSYNLESVTLASTVSEIGLLAFSSTYIINIYVAEGNNSFVSEEGVLFSADMTTLVWYSSQNTAASYTVPETVTTIACAFAHNYNLTEVVLPEGLTTIGDYAFYYCQNLEYIVLPDSLTYIGDYAFYRCLNLTSISIPDSVTYIGKYAFFYCQSLTSSITIPEGVAYIGDHAFYRCLNLTSITIPEGVTSIGDYAFYYCYNLEYIVLPESVTSVGEWSFYTDANTTIYYCGTEEQFNNIEGLDESCIDWWCKIYYSSDWSYDSAGEIVLN